MVPLSRIIMLKAHLFLEFYNNGYVFGTNIEEISIERRQSLLYIINLIKKYKYDNEENSLDSNSIINDLEIFKI